jgi:hypothetical protein
VKSFHPLVGAEDVGEDADAAAVGTIAMAVARENAARSRLQGSFM